MTEKLIASLNTDSNSLSTPLMSEICFLACFQSCTLWPKNLASGTKGRDLTSKAKDITVIIKAPKGLGHVIEDSISAKSTTMKDQNTVLMSQLIKSFNQSLNHCECEYICVCHWYGTFHLKPSLIRPCLDQGLRGGFRFSDWTNCSKT